MRVVAHCRRTLRVRFGCADGVGVVLLFGWGVWLRVRGTELGEFGDNGCVCGGPNSEFGGLLVAEGVDGV